MPAKKTRRPASEKTCSTSESVEEVLDCLHAKSSKKFLDEMGSRYGIHTDKAMGVPMSAMLKLAKEVGGNHELAAALWKTGWYEARTVAALIEEPGPCHPHKWTGGVAISTIGRFATPFASSSSTAPRMHLKRWASGLSAKRSS